MGINLTLIHANGNAKQNFDYCTKADPENYWQLGELSNTGQGQRTDLRSTIETIRGSKTSMYDLAEKHPETLVKYTRGILFYKSLIDKKNVPELRDITVTVYYGEGGTGKTRRVIEDCKKLNLSYYMVTPPNGNSLWFDGMDAENALVLDDFYGWIKPHDLYRILDRYRLQLPIKGGFTWCYYDYVFITSNLPPSQFYSQKVMSTLDDTAYNRRFHNIYKFEYDDETKTNVVTFMEKEEKALKVGTTNVFDLREAEQATDEDVTMSQVPTSPSLDTPPYHSSPDIDF